MFRMLSLMSSRSMLVSPGQAQSGWWTFREPIPLLFVPKWHEAGMRGSSLMVTAGSAIVRQGSQTEANPLPRIRCAPTGNRTPNLLIKSQLLCQLSYRRMVSNLRTAGIHSRIRSEMDVAIYRRKNLRNGRALVKRFSARNQPPPTPRARPFPRRVAPGSSRASGASHPVR